MTHYLPFLDEAIPALKDSDDGDKGLMIMQDHSIRHLPVLQDNGMFLGVISEDIIMDGQYQFGNPVGNFVMQEKDLFCTEKNHWLDMIKFMDDHQFTIAPILDQNGLYKGMATYESIGRQLAKMHFIKDEGSVLIVETNRFAFSLMELAKIIESNESKMMYLDTDLVGEENMWITIKLKTTNLTSVIETLERFGYVIISAFDDNSSSDLLKERYEAFMKFLNI